MRFIALLATLAIGLAAPAAAADPAPPAGFWTVSQERLSFAPAKLSVPRRVGGAEYYETTEFSHKGEGVDTAIKYRSPDQKVLATLYVYYPSIAHSGVQAIATDQAIRGGTRSPDIRSLGTGVAAAAGKPGVAVTADYDHYLGDNHSKAAFIKAGRWMLKLRVTGPESRSAEVAAVMKALLDGLRFEGDARPRPAAPIAAGECSATDRPEAGPAAGGGDAATIAMADAAGDPPAAAARIGRDWCRTFLAVQGQKVTVLQATGGDRPGRDPESVLIVLYSDGGGALEVVRLAKDKYLLLHHDIAEVKVLDSYDRLPSLAQLGRFFVEPAQIRARVTLKPDGTAGVELPGAQGETSP
ncbi:MAG TPA: hypothetical protein VEW26_05640 [Allosphingosinicella sp.]|nr:hypothetical protein [Allosphingosinicella sp.]